MRTAPRATASAACAGGRCCEPAGGEPADSAMSSIMGCGKWGGRVAKGGGRERASGWLAPAEQKEGTEKGGHATAQPQLSSPCTCLTSATLLGLETPWPPPAQLKPPAEVQVRGAVLAGLRLEPPPPAAVSRKRLELSSATGTCRPPSSQPPSSM